MMSLSALWEGVQAIPPSSILVLFTCIAFLASLLYYSRKKPLLLIYLLIIWTWAGLESYLRISNGDSTINHALAAMENIDKLTSYTMASLSVFVCFPLLWVVVHGIKVPKKLEPELPTQATDPSTTQSDVTPGAEPPSRIRMTGATVTWLCLGFWFASRVRDPESHWFYGTLNVICTIAFWEVTVGAAILVVFSIILFVVIIVQVIRKERPQGVEEGEAGQVVRDADTEAQKTVAEKVSLDEKTINEKA